MVALKSLLTGILSAATIFTLSQPSRAGGIITAGSSGTLYYGTWSSWSNSSRAGSTVFAAPIPVALNIPISPPAPAPAPAAVQTNSLFGAVNQTSPVMAQSAAVNSQPSMTIVAGSTAPTTAALPVVATPTPTTQYDAFINFGTAPYADQAMLTTGTAQSWTTSPALAQAYGHTPSAAELADFSQTVLQHVQSTFASSGLAITATTDPSAHAAHMLSVVSGLSALSSPTAIGVTNVGHNGFDFIDKLAYANSPDQLEWAVAHNVAHELMHAFGGEHHTTPQGNNLDAPISDWTVLTDPNTTFSAASVAEMNYDLRQGGLALKYGVGAEQVNPDGQEIQPVPEPATLAVWAAFAGAACLIRRKTSVFRRAA